MSDSRNHPSAWRPCDGPDRYATGTLVGEVEQFLRGQAADRLTADNDTGRWVACAGCPDCARMAGTHRTLVTRLGRIVRHRYRY